MSANKRFPKISLKAARINASLSQREAAAALNINRSTLRNYETGDSVPDWDMVQKISNLYEFPSDFIFFGRNSL